MNLKDWAKIDEDDSSVTMQHPNGHTMKIAVRALPKIQQEQIRRLKLARGGDILDSGDEDVSEQGKIVRHANSLKKRGENHEEEMHFAKEEAKGRAKAERQMPKPKIKGLAEGGRVEKDRKTFADITKKQNEIAKARHEEHERSVSPEDKARSKAFREDADREFKTLRPGRGPGFKKEYAEGSDQTVSQDDQAPTQDDQPTAQPGSTHITINAAAPPQPAQVPGAIPVMQATVPQPNVPANLQTPPVTGGSLNKEAINSLQATSDANAAYDKQAEIDAAQSKAMIPVVQQSMDQTQKIQQARANAYQDISQHTGDYAKYIDDHPEDVRNYIKNMGTGSKIGNGIALFLGGFGTAFGGHNFAFDHIQNMINKDLEAQRDNIHNKKTVLGAYQQLYGYNQAALDAAKISMNDMVAKQADLAKLKLGTPIAQTQAALLKEQLREKNEQLRQNASGYLQMHGGGGGGGVSGSAPTPGQNPPDQGRTDRILSPDAERKYQWAISKFNTVQSPEEKEAIKSEYLNAQQVDEALGQIDKLYPELQKKTTYSGYVADKINPTAVGGSLAAATEALGVAGAIPTGGTSLVASLPAAALAGAGGYGGAAALKQGIRAIGGQTQTQYETALNSLETIVGSALKNSNLTPSEISKIAREFAPGPFDSEKTQLDKLAKLKQKLISVARKGTLKANRMTNER